MSYTEIEQPLAQGEPGLVTYNKAAYPLALEGAVGEVEPDFKIAEYWSILKKRRWTIIAAMVLIVTVTALVSLKTTPIYEAAGRIAIYRESPTSLGLKNSDEQTSYSEDDNVDLETQVKILQSDTVAMDVLGRLGIDQNARSATATAVTAATRNQAALLGNFRQNLRVAVVPKTRIVEVRFASPDPNLAAKVANATAMSYIEQNFKTRYQSTMQTAEWLSKQLADLQMKVELSQEKLVRYQKENGILGLDEKQNIITSKLDELNKELTNAEADRMQKEANYKLGPTVESASGPNGLSNLDKLRGDQTELQKQYAQLTTTLGPDYPKVKEIRSQLEEIKKAIDAETERAARVVRGQYEASLAREKLLQQALENQKAEANQLNEKAIEFSTLKRDVETSRALYDGLLQRLKEAGILAGLKSSNVRIVDTARVPLVPAKPNIRRNIEFSLLGGLVTGVVLAFLFEGLDNTVRTPEQMQMTSGLPSLGIIPLSGATEVPRLKRLLGAGRQGTPAETVDIISVEKPRSEMAEAYRALRTSILLSVFDKPPKLIVVSSALPKEGKTTTCLNTAMVLAQKGAKVLLIDADLRRPRVGRALGLHSRSGLSSVLLGVQPVSEATLPWPQMPTLSVLPAGPIPQEPAELLGSPKMRLLLRELRNEYDHIIIDTPPVLSVTDAVLLSVQADTTVLVIRSAQTTKSALRRACQILAQVKANVMGVVLNAVDLDGDDSYYYYYHYYGGPEKQYYGAVEADKTA